METAWFFRSFDPSLPIPIAFNGWKHHLGFIRQSIRSYEGNSLFQESVANQLKTISGSVLDIYTGTLSCNLVAFEIYNFLRFQGLLTAESYDTWLHNTNQRFKQIALSDGSLWTLTSGRFIERFVHVHPSRYSPFTLRVKSTTLKSAIIYSSHHTRNLFPVELKRINELRVYRLNLSPVKRISNSSQFIAILKIIALA